MQRQHLYPRGFTLIEMMLAIAIGVTICYTAFAGVRTASQCVTIANRLSTENRLMHAAITTSIDDLDFWTSYDDLNDPADQQLRVGDALGRDPFLPMTFNAVEEPDFTPSDPKTWWRGMPTANQAVGTYGNYSLFSNTGPGTPPFTQGQNWLPKITKRLHNSLGVYGLLEYMPANAYYNYFNDDGSRANVFEPLVVSWAPKDQAYSYVHLSIASAYVVSKLRFREPAVYAALNSKTFYDFYPATDTYHMGKMYQKASERFMLITQSPEHWPTVDIRVARFEWYSRWYNNASIVMFSPVGGETKKLLVTGTFTTLRGARQQRGLDVYQ
jgi:prepilin-type N-terminal cleavage/methylation domain-containing protein